MNGIRSHISQRNYNLLSVVIVAALLFSGLVHGEVILCDSGQDASNSAVVLLDHESNADMADVNNEFGVCSTSACCFNCFAITVVEPNIQECFSTPHYKTYLHYQVSVVSAVPDHPPKA